jgi:hypothetical protein
MQFLFGMFLADLSTHPPFLDFLHAHSRARSIAAPLLIIAGLVMASYPEDHAEWISWSNRIRKLLFYILPPGAVYQDFASALGLELIVLGVLISAKAKEVLSNRYLLWMGKNSYAVYLLHGTFIRTLLVWMLFGVTLPADVINETGEATPGEPLKKVGPLVEALVVPIWFLGLYATANLWTNWVDPLCSRVSRALESYFLDAAEKSMLPS